MGLRERRRPAEDLRDEGPVLAWRMAMKGLTKKELAVRMYERGLRIESIAELLHSNPSYVANALIERGHAPHYVDLYTSTGPQNWYAAMLAGVLRFKDVAAARGSVERLSEI